MGAEGRTRPPVPACSRTQEPGSTKPFLANRSGWIFAGLLGVLLSAGGFPLAADPSRLSDLSAAKDPSPAACAAASPVSRVTEGVPYRESALSGKPRVLLAHSLISPAPFLTDLAVSHPDSIALVDTFDLGFSTPTLSFLAAYDTVIVAPDAFLNDPSALGDRLADYVDLGGRVIVTVGTWVPGGWAVGGRFASEGYIPFQPTSVSLDSVTLGTLDPDYPLFGGVSTLGSTLNSVPTPQPTAYVAGRWNDGRALAAVKGTVVALNLHPRSPYFTGDAEALFLNTIRFLMTARLRVLVAPADDFPTQLVGELVKEPKFGSVDYLDGRGATPTLAQLSRYDAIVTWPNWAYSDKVAMGDVLADYVEIGGKVLLGAFCWYSEGNDLSGRIIAQYSPLNSTTGGNHFASANLGSYNGSHPIMRNVTAASSAFRDFTSLAPGATPVALWDDGEYCAAEKGNVVALNAGLMDGGSTGQVFLMARNAVKYLALVYPDAHASSFSGSAPFTVSFTGSATGGQPPYTYRWVFGDGTSSTEQNPSHTYVSPGSYLVQFFPKDSVGHEGTLGFYVTVTEGLTVSASRTPASGTAPLTTLFSSTPSGGSPPYSYDWNWGDGTAHGTAQNPNHTFAFGGLFTTVLTVTDAQGHTASQTLTTLVDPAFQAFAGGAPASGNAPLTATFFGFATGGTPPYTYAWSFSDGGSASGSSVSHTFASPGTYTAALTATDSASHTAAAAPISITVTVPPPVIASLTKKGNPFRIVVSGSNLQSGILVYINGVPWSNVTYQSANQITLKGGSALKSAVPPGTPTTFRFVNPDSGEATVTWSY